MGSKTFNNVTLNVKWKKDTSTNRPDLTAGKDANNYVTENISTTLGKIVRHLEDLGTAAFANTESTLTNGSNIPTGSAVKAYVDGYNKVRQNIFGGNHFLPILMSWYEDIDNTQDCSYVGRDTRTPTAVEYYGIKIAKNDSNPETRCTYMYDCANFSPLNITFDDGSATYNGKINYGDWHRAFFIKHNFPCVVNYDGTIAYRLNKMQHWRKIVGIMPG